MKNKTQDSRIPCLPCLLSHRQAARQEGFEGSRTYNPRPLIILILLMLSFFGCASTQETSQLRSGMSSISNEFDQYRNGMNAKLANIARETEILSKQLINLSSSIDNKEDKIKTILGKLDELEHQLNTYWNETKSEIKLLKKGSGKTQTTPQLAETDYEAIYKEAFDAFQKGMYEESIKKFSEFIESHGGTPFIPNAYYWIGESHMMLKNYEKGILYFQEIIDKYPKSEMAPKALLSQAEAFNSINDKKSSITILKKIIELFPKTEEATIADRKLSALGLQ